VELLTAYVDGRSRRCAWWSARDLRERPRPRRRCQNLVLIAGSGQPERRKFGHCRRYRAPTRIQYQEMIQAVRYIARLSERLLEVSAGPGAM